MFKSKFRDDMINLKKPAVDRRPDGSKIVTAAVWAQFERNTWITRDPELARILREKIKARKEKDPLHVVETTDEE